MSNEPKTIQDVVMQSIQAEDAGVLVDWKQTCLQIVQAAQAEFARITAEQEAENAELKETARAVVKAREKFINADLMIDREYTDSEREDITLAEGNAIDALAALLEGKQE